MADPGPDENDPLQVVAAFNDAWGSHDLERTLSFVTEDCVFDSTSPAPDGECFVGPAAVAAAWKPVFDDVGAQFVAEEVFAAGDRVVQRWRYSWEGGHVRGVDLFKVRDGRVAEKFSYVKG